MTLHKIHYTSTCRIPMDTKLGKVLTYREREWKRERKRYSHTYSHMASWSYDQHDFTRQLKKFIFPLSEDLWPGNLAGCIERLWNKRVTQEKFTNIIKIFNYIKSFVYSFLCKNVWIFQLYMLLQRRINTFWSNSFGNFWSGGIRNFGPKKS